MSQAQASQCITGITGEANLQPATQSTRRKRQQIRAHPRDRNDSGCDFACKNGSVCILPFHVSYPETLSAEELLKAGILIEAASHAQDGDGIGQLQHRENSFVILLLALLLSDIRKQAEVVLLNGGLATA